MSLRSLFARWSGRSDPWEDQISPTGMVGMPPYPTSFERCAALSKAVGGPAMPLTIGTPPERDLHQLVGQAMQVAGIRARHLNGMSLQCAKWSHFLAPAIESVIGTPAWPTVGQFWKEQRPLFALSWGQLREFWRRGVQPDDLMANGAQGFTWHAWITLATGEIIDLTYPSSLAEAHPATMGMLQGRVACGMADEIWPDHRYFPMLASGPVLEALQSRSSLPFLARDVDELAMRFGFGVLPITVG